MRYAVILSICLSACASPQVIEKPVPVEIVKQVYVPLDASLLADCTGKPDPVLNGSSNGQLRASYLALAVVYLPCLEQRLQSIRDLQPK